MIWIFFRIYLHAFLLLLVLLLLRIWLVSSGLILLPVLWTLKTLLLITTRKNGQHITENFCRVTFISIFIFPRAAPDFSLEINHLSFVQVFFCYFSKTAPQYNLVPLGLLIFISVFIAESFCCCNWKIRYCNSAFQITHLRIFSEVSD